MGLLDKLMGRAAESGGTRTVTKTTVRENFKIKVPKDKATPVQHALEQWAQSKGWAALVDAKPDGDFVEFSFQHQADAQGRPPDIKAEKMAEEIQKVLEDALKQP